MTPSVAPELLCPSAQPDWDRSVALGVIGGSVEEPRLSHFSSPVPVTGELLALAGPVTPAEVFRFAAPCMGSGCVHFKHRNCELAARIVQILPVAAERLPACAIRANCRWWSQEGKSACMRCPRVVTDNYSPTDGMRLAATPV